MVYVNKQTGAIVVVAFVIYLLSSAALFIIDLARVVYWVSFAGIIGFSLALVYFGIEHFRNKDDYFSMGSDYSGYAFISLIAIVGFFILFNIGYSMGYSDTAIKTELAAKGYIEVYDEVFGLEDRIMQESIDSLCLTDPSNTCKQIQSVLIWKQRANFVTKFVPIL